MSTSTGWRNIDHPCGYHAAHVRVYQLWGKATFHMCILCGMGRACDWAYDGTDSTELTSKHGSYSRYPEFYFPACRRCHKLKDVRARRSP